MPVAVRHFLHKAKKRMWEWKSFRDPVMIAIGVWKKMKGWIRPKWVRHEKCGQVKVTPLSTITSNQQWKKILVLSNANGMVTTFMSSPDLRLTYHLSALSVFNKSCLWKVCTLYMTSPRGGLRPLWAPGQKLLMGPHFERIFVVESLGGVFAIFEPSDTKLVYLTFWPNLSLIM